MKNKTSNEQIPKWLFTDPLSHALLKTISNRPRSALKRETYAAAYVVDGTIFSFGRNMQVMKKEKWPVIQGYANHAEMMAYCSAHISTPSLAPGYIYVIGFLAQNRIFIHKKNPIRFTCKLCSKKMCEHQIAGVVLPTNDGWNHLSSQEALQTADSFHNVSKHNPEGRINERLEIGIEESNLLLDLLKQLSPNQLIKNMENEFELTTLSANLIRLAKDGYISTKTYKEAVLNSKV